MTSFGSSFGGFGSQQSQPAFGTAAPSAFGQQQPASPFGQQSTPAFGAQPAQGGMFGAQTSSPAFGSSFGQQSSAATFGSTSFGGTSQPFGGGFGSPQPANPSPFGASQPGAFGGASSAPAFGFGQQSLGFASGSSPFGAPAAPTFGASSSGFGLSPSPGFGGSSPAFGQTAGGFGQGNTFNFGSQQQAQQQQQQPQQTGTRNVPFTKMTEKEQGSTAGNVCYMTISCMPQYNTKSVEELRWEDYQAGVKGNTSGGAAFGQQPVQQGGTLFGPQPGAGFATPGALTAQSQPGLSFGAGSNPFGQQSSSAAGFSFAPGSTPAWGGAQSATSPFGGTSTPAFGMSSPAFGASSPAFAFGASSAKPFGQQPSQPSLFGGTPASQPAFGGGTSGFAFGATPQSSAAGASPFGTGTFGTFGQSSAAASPFGAQTPAFGTPQSSPSAFNFSAAASQPAGGSLFGTTPGGGSSFTFGQSSAAAGSSPFSWSTPAQSSGGMFSFGGQSTPGLSPSSGGGLFGPQSSPGLFGGSNTFGTPQSQLGFGIFGGQQPQQQQQMMSPAAMPTVGGSPYGVMPQPLQVGTDALLELRTGLSSRPLAALTGARSVPRTPALFGPRSLAHSASARARPRPASSRSSGLSGVPSPVSSRDRGVNGSPSSVVLPFTPRANPREFFLRDPLPSTEPAARHESATPSRTSSPRPAPSRTEPEPSVRTQPSARPAESDQQGARAGPAKADSRSAHANGSAQAGRAATPSRRTTAEDGGSPAARNGSDALSDDNTRSAPLDRYYKDSEIEQLLPKLTRPDYRTEPSMEELAALAREDPKFLARVANFVVSRRNLGRIRWLERVDVRGLDLDAIVDITPGSIQVYVDKPGRDKPELGEGLNKPAEVTLYSVFKRDKETREAMTDPASVEAYRKRLMRLSAGQRSRFRDYDSETGTWRFEVEHFSRYGLIDSDEDSDEDMGSDAGLGMRKRRSPRSPLDPRAGHARLRGDDDDDDNDDEDFGTPEADMHEGPARQRQRPSPKLAPHADDIATDDSSETAAEDVSPDASAAAHSSLLQQSLAARNSLQPQALHQLHSAFFLSRPDSDAQPAACTPIPPFRKAPVQQQNSDHGPQRQQRQEALAFGLPAGVAGHGGSSARSRPARGPGLTAWQKPAAAITPPTVHGADAERGPSSSLATAASVEHVPMHLSPAAAPGRIPMPRTLAAGDSNLVDAGLCMRRSFGVAWSPSGLYAHTGAISGRTGRRPGTGIIISHAPELSAGSPAERSGHAQHKLELWQRQLQLQLSHSEPHAAHAAAEGAYQAPASVPQWGLKCSREGKLHALCSAMRQLAHGALAKGGLRALDRVCLEHEASTWHLVDVLFSKLPAKLQHYPDLQAREESGTDAVASDNVTRGLDDELAQAGAASSPESAGMEPGNDQLGDADMQEAVNGTAAASLCTAFVRRTALSSWLQSQAAQPAGEACLATQSPLLQIAHLLAAGRAAVAARLALAHGDAKLAAVISQAGHVSGPRELAGQQLASWGAAGMLGCIHKDRLLVWRLLAGQLDDVIPALHLDWRRAFALHLWYGQATSEGLKAAYDAYTTAAEQSRAPEPTPSYCSPQPSAEAPTDVCYWLLEPQVHQAQTAGGGMSAATAHMLVARALAPGTMTPDPLNLLPPWRLLCLLQSVQALAKDHASEGVSHIIAGVISQLGMHASTQHWTAFAALHLPDPNAAGLPSARPVPSHVPRSRAVQELLFRYAPTFRQSAPQQAFLTDQLHVPRPWLARGLAALARSCYDADGEFAQSIAAQDWTAAAAAFALQLGPRSFLRADWDKLAEALQQLQPAVISAAARKDAPLHMAAVQLYAAYLAVKEERASASLADDVQHLSALPTFQQKLQAACVHTQGQLPVIQQAVYQRMASDVASWWARDSLAAAPMLIPMLLPGTRMLLQLDSTAAYRADKNMHQP